VSLLDWQPPQPVARFEPARVRPATFSGQVARAVSEALRDAAAAGLSREEVAARMSAIAGERISKAMLDAYATQAREEHTSSLPRFVALVQATGDRRLLDMLAAPMGWAVIEQADVELIERAALQQHAEEVNRRIKAVQQRTKRGLRG
jgi:hypothetical protein